MPPAQTGGRSSVEPDLGGRVVTRARAVPDVSVPAVLSARDSPRLYWSDRQGLELTGVGAAVRLTADGADRIASIRDAAATLFEDVDHEGPAVTRPRLFGGFSFDAPRRSDRASDSVWDGFPEASFVLPRLQLTREDGRSWLAATVVGDGVTPAFVESTLDDAIESIRSVHDELHVESNATAAESATASSQKDGIDVDDVSTDATRPSAVETGWNPPGVRQTTIRPDRPTWIADVEQTIDRIATGDLRKLVLATAMDVDLQRPVDLASLLERLRATYPECYRFLVQPTAGGAFVGPPPERLVKLTGREVRTEALAGSITRGETPGDDDDRAQFLREDDKRQHEQQLVVDAICQRLAGFGDVTEHEQTVRRLETIQHLRTPISATLSEDQHVLTLVEALHPTPAVGGLPRATALESIRETESFDRGWYAAPVGWFDAAGDGEFTVAIRSGVVDGERATLFAGNGIVADSDPDEEWAEIKPKFRPLLDELE